MQRLDDRSGLRFADPARLAVIFAIAYAEIEKRHAAVERAWRMAVDAELARAGVFARVNATNAAMSTERFQKGFEVRQVERAAAADENDLREIVLAVLAEMAVDLADTIIRLRRSASDELTRPERRHGVAQVRLRAYPTPAAAQRAIDAARAAGYPPPGEAEISEAVAAAGGAPEAIGEQTGQGTSGL
jgi:hypothetical protein